MEVRSPWKVLPRVLPEEQRLHPTLFTDCLEPVGSGASGNSGWQPLPGWDQKTTVLRNSRHAQGIITAENHKSARGQPARSDPGPRKGSVCSQVPAAHAREGAGQVPCSTTAVTYTRFLLWRATQKWEHLPTPVSPRRKRERTWKAGLEGEGARSLSRQCELHPLPTQPSPTSLAATLIQNHFPEICP